jgi:tetratricopeptide (TPR) repeat protein
MTDLLASATQLRAALLARKVSSAELLAATLRRIDRLNPALNAVVAVDAAAAKADAGTPKADAGIAMDAGVDKHQEAKQLTADAKQALDEGEADKALELADRALKLRRTVPTLLVRASALQRLGRTDDALSTIDNAITMAPDYPPSYDQRGRTLWAARRYDDARAAFQKYLELAPNGPAAAEARRRISEPK